MELGCPELTRWDVSKTAHLTYTPANSLDRDIARATAAQYAKKLLLADADLRVDFGFEDAPDSNLIPLLAESSNDFLAYATHFYAVALMERLVRGFEGFTDRATKEPINRSRRAFVRLLKDPSLQDEWLKRAETRIHTLDQSGNG